MSSEGASNNERLMAAARDDNVELLEEVFEQGGFDINYQDGLGNTALHVAVSQGSTDVLEHILSHDDCDVDPINRIEKATPLHLAVKVEHPELRKYLVDSLLEAGADTRIKDKNGETALELVPADDADTRALFRKAQTQSSMAKEEVVDDDDDDEAGSGSGSESD
ncbi:ankyrin repeat-containing domain protein [Schizophyllum amplum]|uniref:Ankyrin repeat-containing domain protein n=1 Tax=Schizophyllum amplum TaxID=97359 RepID=A0A550D0Q1_9AGAR|nr:ankyrin repeat-containing domain protein [Auriculariopsis ampla]